MEPRRSPVYRLPAFRPEKQGTMNTRMAVNTGRGLALLAVLLLGACASLPPVEPMIAAAAQAGKAPTVQLPSGKTSAAAGQRMAAAVDRQSEDFSQHVAVEEAIAGAPLTAGNSVTLLQDGPASYRAMYAAMEQAKDHINIEYFIIEADEAGERLSVLLLKKRAQGVKINLIYDSVGSLNTPREFFDRLREAGVQVVEFHPLNPAEMGKRGWQWNHRDHRKILIVDGVVAFTGGINISGVYSSGSGPGSASRARRAARAVSDFGDPETAQKDGDPPDAKDPKRPGWRDTNIEVRGPAVAELQKLFAESWLKHTGEPLQPAAYFPAPRVEGRQLVRVIGSSPDEPVPTIYATLVSAMQHAQKSIHITMAYFVPDPQTLAALTEAARRDVDVKLVLPSYTDFWAPFYAGRSHYTELLGAGVKIHERQGALLHAKTIVIDGLWSTVGSSNLDWRSFLHNDEVNTVILSPEFAAQMEAMFQRDLKHSMPITLESWKQRPLGDHVKEWGARVWEYWL
jgi:cardiolipin synthase